MQQILADHIEEYEFDGLVFEVGFSEGILPILYAIRHAIGERQLIVTAHPHTSIDIITWFQLCSIQYKGKHRICFPNEFSCQFRYFHDV